MCCVLFVLSCVCVCVCVVLGGIEGKERRENSVSTMLQYPSNFNIILKVPSNFQLRTFNSQQNKKLKPANWIAFTSLSLPSSSSSSSTTTTTTQTASLRSSNTLSSLLSLATSRFKVSFFLLFKSNSVLVLVLFNHFWLWFLVFVYLFLWVCLVEVLSYFCHWVSGTCGKREKNRFFCDCWKILCFDHVPCCPEE